MGRLYGGVGAGPATYLPPRVSFLGVRSLSLVFADFATLLVFVFVFILFFAFSLFHGVITAGCGKIRIRAKVVK